MKLDWIKEWEKKELKEMDSQRGGKGIEQRDSDLGWWVVYVSFQL